MSLKTARCDSRDPYDLHDPAWSAIGAIPRHSCIRVIRAGLVIHAIHVTGVMRTFTKINAGRTHVPGRPAHGDRLLRASELWRGNHGSPPCALCALPEALTRSLPRAFCDAGRTLANRLTAPQRNATRRDCQPSKPFVDGCATNRGTGDVAMRACGSAGRAAQMTQFRKTVRASNPQGWKPELQWLH